MIAAAVKVYTGKCFRLVCPTIDWTVITVLLITKKWCNCGK